MKKIKQALISVSDKSKLKLILKILKKFRIKIISSGGTYKEIKKLGYKSKEISKVMIDALEAAIITEKYPATAIEIHVQILNANAGTRTAAINAASLALANAGIEMRDLVCAVAAGKADDTVLLDLFQPEDNFGQADLPIAVMPNRGEITLVQMDGDLSQKEFDESMKLVMDSANEIYEVQKNALTGKKEKKK